MKLKPYPEYKPSGVEWLGDVPNEWQIKPLKAVVSCNDETLGEDTDPDYEIQYVDISSVDAIEGIQRVEPLVFRDAPSRARRRVRGGDIIVSTVRTYLRAIASVISPPENLIVSTGFAVLRPLSSLLPSFAAYMAGSRYVIEDVIARSTGVSYPAINASDLVRIRVAVPPMSEQSAIATYLDRETTKIDTLIAKQEKLIELLQEKRQVVISHAVTKGLDPTVPMKPSGVEWLGDVPEHWNKMALRFACELLRDGTHLPPPRVDKGVPLLSVRNIQDGRFTTLDDDSFISEEDYSDLCRSFTVQEGDVLLAVVGATLGKVAIVEPMPRFHIQRSLAVLRAASGVMTSEYLAYFLRSSEFQATLWSRVGFSAQPGIYLGVIGGFNCPVPSIEEQKGIAARLNLECAKIDTIIAKAQQAIELQKEHRTALISAAVTGKIDVRGIVDQESYEEKAA
ncbi:restriction endonuclease subunit S [Ralstonia sp. 3PA37C10]|nr:restriction endonuclease subunit S [Ralstonia sp. 3PA37C10]